MPEDAGKLEVEYVVISDAAVRRLERLQKQMDKVEDAATKQGDAIETTYKKAGKAMAAFGAVATGVLYGIIRASSYSSMWMDQISHQMTRIANKILEITGMDEVIENFIKLLDNLADELTAPEDNDFWARLADDFDNLSTRGKIATGVVIALGLVISGIMLLAFGGWLWKIVLAAAAFAGKIGLAGIATKAFAFILGGLKVVLAFLGSTIGIVVLAIAALVIGLTYLWTKTEIGVATIQSLINIWNNFKHDISEIGWLGAIVQALKDFGYTLLVAFVKTIRMVYDKFISITGEIVKYAKEVGGRIITWLIDGIKDMIPRLVDTFWYIYDNFWTILENVKTLAWNKALEIYQRLVDGFNAALQWVKGAFSKLTDIWNEEASVLVVEARHTGEDVVKDAAKGVDMAAPIFEAATTKAGERASDGLRDGVAGMHEPVCREMTNAERCAQRGMVAIEGIFDDSLDSAANYHTRMLKMFSDTQQAAWDAASDVEKAAVSSSSAASSSVAAAAAAAIASGVYVDSSWGTSISPSSMPGGGDYGKSAYSDSSYSDSYSKSSYSDSSYGDSYHAGSSVPSSGPGAPDYGATGGHVLRTGIAMIHQGEDIIHLKSLLAGISSGGDNSKGGDIIINPTINITSGGVNHDPFETNRVADVISKRMGEELRRITTNI